MAPGIRPEPHVGGGHAQALLDHPCPHGVPGAGVMLGVGNQAGGDSQDHGWIELQMGVIRGDVLLPDGNEAVFLLLCVQVFHEASCYQIGECHLSSQDLVDMLFGDPSPAILDHYQRPPSPAGVGVHEDLAGVLEIGHIRLAADAPRAPEAAEVLDQSLGVIMIAHYLAVHIYSGVASLYFSQCYHLPKLSLNPSESS